MSTLTGVAAPHQNFLIFSGIYSGDFGFLHCERESVQAILVDYFAKWVDRTFRVSIRTTTPLQSGFMGCELNFGHRKPGSRALTPGWFCHVATIYGKSAAGADIYVDAGSPNESAGDGSDIRIADFDRILAKQLFRSHMLVCCVGARHLSTCLHQRHEGANRLLGNG